MIVGESQITVYLVVERVHVRVHVHVGAEGLVVLEGLVVAVRVVRAVVAAAAVELPRRLTIIMLSVVVIMFIVAVVSERLRHTHLGILEHDLVLVHAEHFGGIALVLVGHEAVATRLTDRIGDDARISHGTKRRKVVSQLVLIGL